MPRSHRGPVSRWRGLFALFFLSGISGLIYESIWSRYIRQFVGSAATAQVLVLALFMGGMSLGAFLASRWLHRIRRPVMVYGLIEGAIGLYALAFPHLHDGVMRLCYDVVFPMLGSGETVEIVKWSMATALILPPCILLGTTFPVMSVGILRREPAHSGQILSFLYFTNSFGAALGALLSGFVFVAMVGLPGTLAIAAALNFSIMVVAIRDRKPAPPLHRGTAIDRSPVPLGRLVWLFLAIAFGTGLSSFMYEIGWIRLLSMIIGSATHSFEVMLSAFVLGLALGGLWVRKRMDRWKQPELVLAFVQLLMGMAAIATLPLYAAAVGAMSMLMGAADQRTTMTWIGFNILRYLLSLLIMLPATFCAGMTLPLVTHVMLGRGQAEGVVGHVYAINTLGAIAGAVLAGILLMPLIGLKGIIVLGALVDMLLGLAVLRWAVENLRVRSVLRTAALSTVAMLAIGTFVIDVDPAILTSTVFRKGRFRLPDYLEVLSYEDGRTASVTVVENTATPGHRIIYTNGKPDASVMLNRWPEGRTKVEGPDMAGDEPNQFLVGLLPLMVRPETRDAALIGFGSGVTCHTLLGSPALERLDTIEIEREMVHGGQWFRGANDRAYEDPRNHIWFDDAKAYFAAAGRKYDLIVSEPTNPWVSGVASLFTVEFYREVKRYLRPGGVFAQWVQGYELSNELLISVLAAIDDEFSDYLIVRIGGRDWVILAVPEGRVGRPVATTLDWPGMRQQLQVLGIHDIGQVDALVSANRAILHPFIRDRTPNTDRHPLLDTGAEKTRFFRESAEMLNSIRWTPAPVLEALGGVQRRPYPLEGIGDLRDPHILREAEQAALLMRVYTGEVERVPIGMSPQSMYNWIDARKRIDAEGKGWSTWLAATYEVYRESASHLQLHRTQWWARVLDMAQSAPPRVQGAVELLDALETMDGRRLWPLVEGALKQRDYPLPRAFVTIAGLIALELRQVPGDERRAYVRRHMDEFGVGEDSQDVAYRVLRAHGMRGDEGG